MKANNNLILLLSSLLSLTPLIASAQKGKHLFILSGQSNMVGLKPEESFTPKIMEALGKENVIIVKDAMGSQPIHRWYKDWKPLEGNEPKADPALYDSLIKKVHAATKKKKIATVTFIWMQGERDAREKWGNVYEKSLMGLYQQLSKDVKRTDVNFVIGRLSDFGMQNKNYPDWQVIRDIQMKVAESNPRFGWVNTDDLNDGTSREGKTIQNDIHMSGEGYKILGDRFADKAIELIKANKN